LETKRLPDNRFQVSFGQFRGEGATREEALKPVQQDSYRHIYEHEAAHAAAAGNLMQGGIVVNVNSDGIATSGHVMIAFGEFNPLNPAESYHQASTAYRAALAPSDPSPQDLAVAKKAQALMARAQAAMREPPPGSSRVLGWG
jgi:hypothetical protein